VTPGWRTTISCAIRVSERRAASAAMTVALGLGWTALTTAPLSQGRCAGATRSTRHFQGRRAGATPSLGYIGAPKLLERPACRAGWVRDPDVGGAAQRQKGGRVRG